MLPAVAVTVPDIETAEAVICPYDFNTKAPFELLIVVGSNENQPMTPEPVATIVSAVMFPII